MVHQRLVVVFGDYADVADAGVGHVGQGKVDLAVPAAIGQRGDGTFVGQVAQGAVIDVGENNTHCFHHAVSPFNGPRREQHGVFRKRLIFAQDADFSLGSIGERAAHHGAGGDGAVLANDGVTDDGAGGRQTHWA